jgi:hypothetical protein
MAKFTQSNQPASPAIGDLWFDNTIATAMYVKVFTGDGWKSYEDIFPALPANIDVPTVITNQNSFYRTILEASGSHIAGKVAGLYAMGMGDPLAVSGTGVLYPIQLINIVAADYPTVNGLAAKLRVRAIVDVNGVAPTGNFTVGLYPVTSGGGAAGLKIYTMGTLISGSAASSVTAPGANSMTAVAGSDFALPADGVYCLAVVTTATIATSALIHIGAALQIRNA